MSYLVTSAKDSSRHFAFAVILAVHAWPKYFEFFISNLLGVVLVYLQRAIVQLAFQTVPLMR